MKQSGFLKWNFRDFFHGLLMAILVPVAGIIKETLESGSFSFDWKHLGTLALAGGFGYLIKKLFEGGKNE